MNTNRIPQVFRGTILTVLLATAASLLGGCYVETRPAYAYEETDRSTVVESAPPPDRVEVVGAAPYADGVWIKGNWRWTGREYSWNGGHWEHRKGAAFRR